MIESAIKTFPLLLNGLAVTLWLSVIVIIMSLILGTLLGLVLVYAKWPLALTVRIFSDVIRGIPVLVLIFFIFYALPVIGVNLPNFAAAVVALTVFKTSQTIEIVRGAVQSIHHGQIEASKAIGLTFSERMIHVVLPQALRRFLPPWINGVVDAVKGSALVSLVGVVDLLGAVQEVVGRTFQPLPVYVLGAAIYVAINMTLSLLSRRLEARFEYIKE